MNRIASTTTGVLLKGMRIAIADAIVSTAVEVTTRENNANIGSAAQAEPASTVQLRIGGALNTVALL